MRKLIFGETWQLPLGIACSVGAGAVAHVVGAPDAIAIVVLVVGLMAALAASLRA